MYFSVKKRELIRAPKGQALVTFALGLAVAALMFLPSILKGDGYFIFYGDFNVQQIPFYQNCHQAVRSGNINWSWTTDLGSGFIGSYSFYLLGSPFFWLTLLFPTSMVPYLMGPLLVLKFACATLTSYLFIRRFTMTPAAARVGALLYAFSGFSVYNIFFNHFHEPIIIFPLLLLSLELLWTENKRGLFAICVALSAVINYFFFVGMVLFCFIYWLVRLISGAIKFKITRFLILAFESVLGVAIAAFILIPSVHMVVSNSRVNEFQIGWGGILYGREQIYLQIFQSLFFPPDIPAHPVFVPSLGVKWSSIAAWLPVIGTTATFGFYFSRKGHWLKRVLCICAVMSCIPVLNSSFYALNDSYYARWFYMPILLMCLASAFTFEDDSIDWKKGFKYSLGFTLCIALVIGLFPQMVGEKLVWGLYTDSGEKGNIYFYRFLISVIIALLSLLICRGLIALKNNKKTMFGVMTAVVCIISVIYGVVFIDEGQYHSADIKDTMIDRLIEAEVELPDNDEQNYRIDTYSCSDNTGMYLGYPTINAFHSVVSPSIMEFYDYIGITRDVASRPPTEYTFLRSLLSVRFLLNRTNSYRFVDGDGKTVMPGYTYVDTLGGYYVFENENYLPYGFSYDYYITDKECELLFGKKERADIMLKALVVPHSTDESMLVGMKHFNVEELQTQEGMNASGGFTNENIELEDVEYKPSLRYDYNTLSLDAAHLKQSCATEFSYDNKGFYATVERDEKSLVFFSVPFDKGWSVKVNGKPAKIVKANIGFMAVQVGKGISQIEFSYTTPGLANGIKLSLLGIAVLVVYIIVCIIIKRFSTVNENYPEGEQLLGFWCREQTKGNCEVLEFENAKNNFLDITEPTEEELADNGQYDNGFHIDISKITNNDLSNSQEENDEN